jgi:hypothetical protein
VRDTRRGEETRRRGDGPGLSGLILWAEIPLLVEMEKCRLNRQ